MGWNRLKQSKVQLLKTGSNLAKDVRLVYGCMYYKAPTGGELKDATILRGYFRADCLKLSRTGVSNPASGKPLSCRA